MSEELDELNVREAAEEGSNSDKMGTMPVKKLLFSMAAPMIVAMLVQALYNIVDSIFVAQLSQNALTSVTLAFPIQSLMIAVSTGLGVGMNAALSRSLGERNPKRAGKIALNGLFLFAIGYVLFLLIGIFASRPFLVSQTDIAGIVDGGVIYLTICCCCSVGLFFEIAFERLLQSTGRTLDTLISQGIGALINLALDPILIFDWGLGLGIAGAAIATVFGQIVAATIALVLNLKRNKELSFDFRGFRPEGEVVKTILVVSVPSILMQAIGSVMSYGMNRILLRFTETAATVFGVYFKLQSFVFMPIFGLNNGMVPIVAYNYGARQRKRMVEAIKLAMIAAISIMLIGLLVMQLIPDKLLLMFDASADMLAIGIPALRTLSICFVFAGFCIIAGSVFQALGNGIYSLLISFVRQVVILLPVAYLLSLRNDVSLVWWAFPIAEISAVALSLFFLWRTNRKVLKTM